MHRMRAQRSQPHLVRPYTAFGMRVCSFSQASSSLGSPVPVTLVPNCNPVVVQVVLASKDLQVPACKGAILHLALRRLVAGTEQDPSHIWGMLCHGGSLQHHTSRDVLRLSI